MFSQDRRTMRQMYVQAWKKQGENMPLSPLEQQIVEVISEHPEYQQVMDQPEKALEKAYFPELGEANPFLHLSLHLGLREQVATNRPAGIKAIFLTLAQQVGYHEAEHQMMNCLAELLWQAQRQGRQPDEAHYLNRLRNLLSDRKDDGASPTQAGEW